MAQYQGLFPTPQAPAGAARPDYESPNLTPESQQHLDGSTPEVQSPGSKKSSLISKIKDKTQQLKTKVKKELHSRTSDKTTDTSAGQGDGTVTSYSEDDRGNTPGSEVPYSQLPKRGEAVADRDFDTSSAPTVDLSEAAKTLPVLGEGIYEKTVSTSEGPSTENMFTAAGKEHGTVEDLEALPETQRVNDGSPDFISPYRTPGPADTLQAVPTQYFYKEPRIAPSTDEDSDYTQSDVPSAAGQTAAEETPIVAGWGGNDEVPSATSRDYPSGAIDDSVTQGPFPTDQQEFKGSAAAANDDLPFTERVKEAALAAGSAETAKHHLGNEAHSEKLPSAATRNQPPELIDDSISQGPFPTDQQEFKGSAAAANDDLPFSERVKEAALAAGSAETAKHHLGGNDAYTSEDKSHTEHAAEAVTNVADRGYGEEFETKGSEQAYDRYEEKSVTDRADESVTTGEDAVGGAAYETTGDNVPSEHQPFTTEHGTDGLYDSKDAVTGAAYAAEDEVTDDITDSSTFGEVQQPYTDKAKDSEYGTDNVVGDTHASVYADEQKPLTERAVAVVYSAKDKVVDAVSAYTTTPETAANEKPYTQRAKEAVFDVKDRVVGYGSEGKNPSYVPEEKDLDGGYVKKNEGVKRDPVYGSVDGAENRTAEAVDMGNYVDQKPYTECVTETLGTAKDQVVATAYNAKDAAVRATETGNEGTQGKTWTDKTKDTWSGVVDTVGSKLGYGSDTQASSGLPSSESVGMDTSAEQKPFTQKVQESAYSAKDVIASKLGYASTQESTDTGKVLGGTVNDGLNEVKDTAAVTSEAAAARFQPDEHDKALSEKITSTLGGLSLGGNSPKTASSTDADKGIFGRVSEGVSSLLWKKPTASSEKQDVPTNSLPEAAHQIEQDFEQPDQIVTEN